MSNDDTATAAEAKEGNADAPIELDDSKDSADTTNNKKRKASKSKSIETIKLKKRGPKPKPLRILSISEVTMDQIDSLSAENARKYILHYNNQYDKHARCPRNRAGRISSLKDLVSELKKK